jgi:PAS domain S-box-containing protein
VVRSTWVIRAATTRATRALLLASLLFHASSARGGSVLEDDQRWLAGRPAIRVGLESGYAPYSFVGPDGRPSGIAVDHLRLLEQRTGLGFEVTATADLSSLLEMARRGEIDLLPSLMRTPERDLYLDFTRPYFASPAVLVVAKGREGPERIEAMGSYRIAVGSGYAVEGFLRERHPGLQLVPAPNDAEALRLLLSGAVHGAVIDLASLSWILTTTGIQGLRVLGDVGFTYELSFAARSGMPQLQRVLDAALRDIPPADSQRIRDEWVRVEIGPRGVDPRTWAWLAFSVVGAVLLALTVFGVNWAMRRVVERRTQELERTRRTLLMLTRSIEAILRASTEEELFAGVCRVIVETGGYRMCWAGVAGNDERKTVRPVAHAGIDDGYLEVIDVVWADVPAGRGPTGTAIREGRVVVGYYFADEDALTPWKSEALRRGYASATALPISFGGETVGALSMYSGTVAPVGEEELRFLRQLADDVAFGVQALRQRTARVRADAGREAALLALSSEQDRFRALIEGSSDLTIVIDRDGIIRFANPTSFEVIGRSPVELEDSPVLDHVHPDDHRSAQMAMAEALASPGATSRVEVRVRRADGTYALVESGLRNLLDTPGVAGVVVNNRDITERNRYRDQFQQAQKLESVGRLAGGVAHDFNNLLTIILSCAEELQRELEAASPRAKDSLEDIVAAARKAGDLTRQLLAFARKQMIAPEIVDLNGALRQSKKLLGRVIGEDVRVVEQYQADLWPVRCDPGLLSQVVMNLAINARDAMPRGGTLTLSTGNLDLRPGVLPPVPDMGPGPWVRLTVADTGVGMTADVLAHVFEPFFTTKAPGVGTGLGLATVYGIVRQSGAYLTVRSTPGVGSTFDVFFPRAPEDTAATDAPEVIPPPGTETVLVVEDDPKVREVTVRALRSGGYRVLAAEGAEPAYEIVHRHRGVIHLVVTDVVMPGTGGREMARRIVELRPGVRVLYVSGYTHDAISQQGVLDEGIEFLPKPFTSAALLARVRALLDPP